MQKTVKLTYRLKIKMQVALNRLLSKQIVAVESNGWEAICFLYRGKAEANYTHTKHCESEKQHNSAQRLFKMRQEQNKLVKEEQQEKKMKTEKVSVKQ